MRNEIKFLIAEVMRNPSAIKISIQWCFNIKTESFQGLDKTFWFYVGFKIQPLGIRIELLNCQLNSSNLEDEEIPF